MHRIDTGDNVFHRPSGETWIVAGVEKDRLMWIGWPEGTADVDDCELIEKATPERRYRLLDELANMAGDDMRKRYAVKRLESDRG